VIAVLLRGQWSFRIVGIIPELKLIDLFLCDRLEPIRGI
jgi:hypothetical protein